MANRPIFIAKELHLTPGVIVKDTVFKWYPGMSKSQKQKSIADLHASGISQGLKNILEISSKSQTEIGVKLSAFNLKIATPKKLKFSVETAFQSSKVFENGGPYTDLLHKTSREAKKDIRLKESGNLLGFSFFGKQFSTSPHTFFYDWIYLNALKQNPEYVEELIRYDAFTDIEFNPKKSLNGQAYSAALFVSLYHSGKLNEVMGTSDTFLQFLESEYAQKDITNAIQTSLI
jgi:hypothetical protein